MKPRKSWDVKTRGWPSISSLSGRTQTPQSSEWRLIQMRVVLFIVIHRARSFQEYKKAVVRNNRIGDATSPKTPIKESTLTRIWQKYQHLNPLTL